MAQEEEEYNLLEKFAAAVKVMWNLPAEGPFQLSDDMMLMFYGYYQQATKGPCNIPRPIGFWDSHGKAKWDAWNSLGNMTKEEAMKNYVEDIQLILETIPISDEVSDLVQKLGNFYTEVDEDVEEAKEDRRPFTRPFAQQAGYGDLWDDIQNPREKDSVHEVSVSSEEAVESKESSLTKEETSEEEEKNDDEEDASEDEGKEHEREWNPDPRLLRAGNKRWRSDTWGSGTSLEPSVSSFTNGTHSSLNSEVEEEELACSIEPGHLYMHFNGHRGDHKDDAPEKNFRSTDSENEEFCDSMEHLAMEEALSTSKVQSPGVPAVRQKDLWFESTTTLNGDEDFFRRERSGSAHHNSAFSIRGSQPPKGVCVHADGACRPVSQNTHRGASGGNVEERIGSVLLRLQHDMADVLSRLHNLEELTVSQSRSSTPSEVDVLPVTRKCLRPSWWPFEQSPFTVVLTALWPLIAHWLVQLYLQRKRRKIT